MSQPAPQPKYRTDYRPPNHRVRHVELEFDIGERVTEVRAELDLERNPERPPGEPLYLDGEDLRLTGLTLDGRPLSEGDYRCFDGGLEIPGVPERFRLSTTVEIDPDNNTALEGLYRSGDCLCTQCEAEGFRRITYFPDRPDVMASYRTTISADKQAFPVLLCNGNPVASGDEGGRHWVTWEDPHPKPSYLFALVAGDLACVEDRYRTASGREVALRFYVEHGNEGRCGHAMASLKAAMAWDERVYGLEYDLDVYMIVAVSAFNMGAMENKGLNLFNDRYILADSESATDDDYLHIEDVVGHEYFHNWTGNRVTLRDWFQLSLKESLTVFRERCFSADQGLAAVKRIGDVRHLRRIQFAEDAGPLAHPVRPESYIEMNNFYTTTIYEKGAEVIGMLHSLLGHEAFLRGVRDYLGRFDGQAVTIEDFIATLESASGADLGQFRLWYSQPGTPTLRVSDDYAGGTGVYELTIRQDVPAVPGYSDPRPLHIPLTLSLLDAGGRPVDLAIETDAELRRLSEGEVLVHLRGPETRLRCTGLASRPVPSLLRGFSAPVKLEPPYGGEALHFLARHESDPFSRWEAGQQLLLQAALEAARAIQSGGRPRFDAALADTFGALLELPVDDPALVAEMIRVPGESYIAEQMQTIDPAAVTGARDALHSHLARALAGSLEGLCDDLAPTGAYCLEPAEIGRRRLLGLLLEYLSRVDAKALARRCRAQFEQADNMTDTLAAMAAVNNVPGEARESLFSAFEQRWGSNPLVMDKWLRLQAVARRGDALERIAALMEHPAFSLRNPNRVRALLGSFAAENTPALHAVDGGGYAFLADRILEIDHLNGQVAARLAGYLSYWRRYEPVRRDLMRQQLERVRDSGDLSTSLYEVVNKSLSPAA